MSEKTQPGKIERKDMQVKQQIFHNLSEVVELYPKYRIAEHLSAILRRKNTDGPQFHYWTNDELLKKIEQHKADLEGDEIMNIASDEDNDY